MNVEQVFNALLELPHDLDDAGVYVQCGDQLRAVAAVGSGPRIDGKEIVVIESH